MNAEPSPSAHAVMDSLRRAAQLLDAGDARTAHALLGEALVKDRRNPDTLCMIGDACIRLSRMSEAVRHLRLCVQLRPLNPTAVSLLAEAHASLGEVGPAHRALDAYLAHDPRHPRVLAMKARLFQTRGQNDRALEFLEAHLADDDDQCGLSSLYGSACLGAGEHARGIDRLRTVLERVDIAPGARRSLFMSLGHLLDAHADYDEAFAAFERANLMLEPHEPRDFEVVTSYWTPEVLASIAPAAAASPLPVVIVGMPRSGTTLTEQALGVHPQVASVGESDLMPSLMPALVQAPPTAESVGELGRRYLAGLSAAAATGQTRVIDKLPGNYVNLGAIVSALPMTSVIHCTRDPRDVCLSCFFQDFGTRHPYSRRLETCARAYIQHLRIMEYWRQHLPLRVVESNYGRLVADPRPAVEALLAHAGLPWHEGCLEPHKARSTVTTASIHQVRQPIYTTSRQRWRRYEKHLGPMLEVLAEVL